MDHDELEILVIEDNPADVELFERVMSGGAYRIRVARTGAEAVDWLLQPFQTSVRPDLIVLDLNVPILNGHQVLSIIRLNPSLRSIPVVVFSISNQIDDVLMAYELGASAYMVKPRSLLETEQTLSAFADYWIRQVAFPGLMRVPSRTSDVIS